MTTFADTPRLRGDRIVLRPIVAGDASSTRADLADDEADRLAGTHRAFTRSRSTGGTAQWSTLRPEPASVRS